MIAHCVFYRNQTHYERSQRPVHKVGSEKARCSKQASCSFIISSAQRAEPERGLHFTSLHSDRRCPSVAVHLDAGFGPLPCENTCVVPSLLAYFVRRLATTMQNSPPRTT